MISLIWKYYSDPVTVVPNKWITPVERLVAFPTGVAGNHSVLHNKFCINHTSFLAFILLADTFLFFYHRWSGNHLLVGSLQ